MPCDTTLRKEQTLVDRNAEIKRALARLEASLKAGRVSAVIGPTGAVALKGWTDRDDITDVCAIRTLQASNSWELRQAIAKAEMQSGRKMNPNAVAAGHHMHGDKWHKGH
jgi:hypothetical protein